LQALPEQPRLPDPPDLVPPRDDSLLAILHHELAQRVHQVRPQLLEPLVVRPQRKLRQSFLRIRRRLLAVNPKRRARAICSLRGLPAIQRRDAAVVRRVSLAVQDSHFVQIVHLVRHSVFMTCDVERLPVAQASACGVWLRRPRASAQPKPTGCPSEMLRIKSLRHH